MAYKNRGIMNAPVSILLRNFNAMPLLRYFFIVLLISGYYFTLAQSQFGLQFGLIRQAKSGFALCDSISVHADTGDGPAFPGLFYNQHILKIISSRVELNIYKNSLGALVYNNEQNCTLCPVVKAGSYAYRTIELPVFLKAKIPLSKIVHVGVVGGFGFNFNFLMNNSSFSFQGQHPGVADVLNTISNTIKPVIINYIYGLSFDIWRITLIARYQHNLGSSIVRDINVWGNRYSFQAYGSYVHFTVSYNFFNSK